jgi:hypothetical protein
MKNTFLALSALLLLSACSKSSFVVVENDSSKGLASVRKPAQQEDYQSCQPIDEDLLIDEVNYSSLDKSFDNVKEHIFKNNCASCHFGKDSYLPHLDDYDSTRESVNSGKLLKAVDSGKMPPSSSLANRDSRGLSFLRAWINSGAPR